MVTKRTNNPRGRPKIPLPDDPDFFVVAMTLATMTLLPPNERSLRRAAKIVAAIEVGNEIELSSVIIDPKTGISAADIAAKCPAGLVAVGFGPTHAPRRDDKYFNTRPGKKKKMPATIKGRARTIEQKANAMCRDPECMKRLRLVVDGILCLQHPLFAAKGRKLLAEAGVQPPIEE
jgi:hypothetical protein